MSKPTQVSLVKSPNSYSGVISSLELLKKSIVKAIKNKRKIVIKPNIVSVKHPLSATSFEAMKAVLDFFSRYTRSTITIAEGSATENTLKGYKKLGFTDLTDSYNIKFVDLNQDQVGRKVRIMDVHGQPLEVGIAKTITDADFIISLTKPKTHDTGVVTLSLKNLLMGSIFEKYKMHQGRKFHWNLLELSKIIKPSLAIIDGTVSMEGEGPAFGEPKKTNFAAASLDSLALDSFVTSLMGFKLKDVGYLWLCHQEKIGVGDLSKIKILGENPKNFQFRFKPHPTYKHQVQWQKVIIKKANIPSKIMFPIMGRAKKLIPGKILLLMQEIKPLRQIVVKINNGF